ncbi:ethylene-overproduction protein 1-like, partial [Trifolium medium]|nr:ethylene-overproduction protein 1-like [Trifolium medium]
MDCCGRNLECPKASLVTGYDPESGFGHCSCFRKDNIIVDNDDVDDGGEIECSTSYGDEDDRSGSGDG